MQRRTRIVATLGPSTDDEAVLSAMLDVGLDVARINFSHGSAEEHGRRAERLRQLTQGRDRPVALLGDLPGPKIRVAIDSPLSLQVGDEIRLSRTGDERDGILLNEPSVLTTVDVGHRVLLDDGRIALRVEDASAKSLTLRVVSGGTLQPNKGVNFPDSPLDLPEVTERDLDALAVAARIGVDWLALSFVRSASAASKVRQAAEGVGLRVPILAKIERPEALDHVEAIIDAFDGVMVARGDLGVEIPLERVPHEQKRIILACRTAGKPAITATDMLDSMRNNPRPTRAEVSDVANAVYDGSDALMLSGETAVGRYPIEAVQCMDRIAQEAESHLSDAHWARLYDPPGDVPDHLTQFACELAENVEAHAIVVPTFSGRTARSLARHRPLLPIVVPCPDEELRRQLALTWGLTLLPFEAGLDEGADRLTAAVRSAWEHGAVQEGMRLVVLAGHPLEGRPGLPTVRVVGVGQRGESLPP